MWKSIVFIVALTNFTFANAKLEEVFKWKQIDWKWPSEEVRNNAIKSGEFVPGNGMPNAIARWKNKLFVTIPRWKPGVVSALNYVLLNSTDDSPALIPYPNWESNRITKDNINSAENITVSLFRIDVDSCDRLWILDNGFGQTVGGYKLVHPPTLVIFDLKTDTVIRRYTLKPGQYSVNSMFPNTIVDATADKCDKAFAYLPNIQDNSIIVYSFAENDSWKVTHNYFSFEPLEGDLTIEGFNFQWHDGIFSIALGPVDNQGFRTAYFHCLIGTHEFSVNTRVLRNKTLATNTIASYHLYKVEGKKGENTQSSSSAFDMKNDILFLTQINKDGLGCWNTKKSLNPQNFGLVAQDHKINVFPNDIKIDDDRNLWILSDKMPIFIYGKPNLTEINFRVLKISVDEAIKGTVCELK